MSGDLFYFKQRVFGSGYKLATPNQVSRRSSEEVTKPEVSLVLGDIEGHYNSYSPMERQPALFRIFSNTPETKKGVLEFANLYGMLGKYQLAWVDGLGKGSTVEPVSWWYSEISALRRMIALWDAVQAGDSNELAKLVYWGKFLERDIVSYQNPDVDHGEVITDSYFRPYGYELLDKVEKGNLSVPARLKIQIEINTYLAEHVSPIIMFDREDVNKQSVHVVPKNLLGAMWLQFAQSIEGNTRYRKCKECQTTFKVSSSEKANKRLFCSDACKSREFRRKKKAKQI